MPPHSNKENRAVEERRLSCSLQEKEKGLLRQGMAPVELPFGHRDALLRDIEDEEAADSEERRVLLDFYIKSVENRNKESKSG